MHKYEQLTLFEPAFYEGHPKIIGICGKLHSGKDTVCQFIQESRSDLNVRRDAFADRLKLSAARSLGVHGSDKEVLDDINNFKERGYVVLVLEGKGVVGSITGREYLQFSGTEGGREVFGNDFWTRQVIDKSQGAPYWGQDPFDILVITDVRFGDEAQAVLDMGGEIWQVVRDNDRQDSHISEAGVPAHLVTLTIDNTGTLDELKTEVAELCR